jgi:hypothetical protein
LADGKKCILQLYIWNQNHNSSITITNLGLCIAFASLEPLFHTFIFLSFLKQKMGTTNVPGGLRALIIWSILLCFSRLSFGAKTRHFKWEVEYLFWSPDCIENVVMGINGQFPGPTIRAKAGDTVVVELTNKLSTEGVVIHWHGIRQVWFGLV